MTGYEFRERYNEDAQKAIANEIAQTITIRTYNNKGSHDITRQTTEEEKAIISKVADAALSAYGYINKDIDGILHMAECSLFNFIGHEVNTYDTIYIPLRKATKTGLWDDERR